MTKHENRKVIILENAEKVAEFTAVKLIEIAETAIAGTGRFTVALSGGKTPVTLFPNSRNHCPGTGHTSSSLMSASSLLIVKKAISA
jgi:hypothetical protein